MSDVITKAVEALTQKVDKSFSAKAKFIIPGEGTIIMDSDGVRAADEDADVTLTASAEVFQGILDGNTNPTMAFMTGKLSIGGNMELAMRLASILS